MRFVTFPTKTAAPLSDDALDFNRTMDPADGSGSGQGQYAPYNPGIRGYQNINDTLNATWVSMISGQDFKRYATPFEKAFSVLCGAPNGLDPVVDLDYLVIGHLGYVTGDRLWVPRGWMGDLRDLTNDPVQIALGMGAEEPAVPVYAVSSEREVDTNYWVRGSNSEVQWLIYAKLDGRVMKLYSGQLNRYQSMDSFLQLDDLYYIAKIAVDLGAGLGKRLLKAALRREAGKEAILLLEGATAEVAERSFQEQIEQEVANRTRTYNSRGGITQTHFKAFQEAATETKVVAMVRNGKESAIPLIERGCPGKPKIFEPFNTNPATGILTATKEADKQLVYKSNYILVDDQRVATRMVNGKLERVELKDTFWQLEPGQVIDPKYMKPVVGDYDLMGVFSMQSTGQNVTLAVVDDVATANRTSPIVEELSRNVNRRMDMPRVLHGAQDQYKGFRGGATAFFPDGTVVYMETQEEVEAFYAKARRQPITGAHPRPSVDHPNPDIGGARKR
jgi:hypothetical protein